MIAAWMLWSVGIGLLFFLAGLATERLLTLGGHQIRGVWVIAGVATVVLPGLRLLGGSPGQEVAPPSVAPAVLEPLEVTVSNDSILRSFDDVLLLGWVVLSSMLVVTVLFAFARLVREGKSWEPGSLGDRSVLWSRTTGPTVVGLLRPSVVLPAWVRAVNSSQQELILLHEAEHIRAGDARLRFLMTLPLLAFPWNPALWLQRHRLSLAIELDCDRRVMQRMPSERRTYGDLLLRVGAGRSGLHRLAIVSLAEGRSQLERRIRGLVERVPRARRVQGLLLLLGAAAIVALAVLFPRIRGEGGGPVDEQFVDLMAEPTFTPFTVRPDLVNEREVQQALEREYPRMLRDEGIAGTVQVHFFIDAEGEVRRVLVARSSQHEALDSAALRVARVFRFTPALNMDEAVPVWIAIPITFGTVERAANADDRVPARLRELFDSIRAGDSGNLADSVPARLRELIDSIFSERAADPGNRPTDSDVPQEASLADAPTFTPFTERPELLNEEEVREALEEQYPPILRDAGIGGTVQVYFFIDAEGQLQRVLVEQTSGHEALDSAALRVARIWRFSPARNLGEPVPAWIAIPITFQQPPPPEEPKAPAPRQEASLADAPTVTPFTVRPDLVNEPEVMQAMEDEYPPILRDAGIGGTVLVHVFVSVDGAVENVLVARSSGHEPLDEAGLRVARAMRFTPARNEDEIVPVWIAIPFTFVPDQESLEAAKQAGRMAVRTVPTALGGGNRVGPG